jgi:hypothetical protein
VEAVELQVLLALQGHQEWSSHGPRLT